MIETASLRRLRPDIYIQLESIAERLYRYDKITGPAVIGWDNDLSKIRCLGGNTRATRQLEERHPNQIIGYFDSRSSFMDLHDAVIFYLHHFLPLQSTSNSVE